LQLVKFTYQDDGNESGLAVEFRNKYMFPTRNAVVMSMHGRQFSPIETANALRKLARWCETVGYNAG